MIYKFEVKGPIDESDEKSGNFEDFFTGSVNIKLKNKQERLEVATKMQMQLNSSGEIDQNIEGNVKRIKEIDEFIQNSIVSWELSSVDGSTKFNSVEDILAIFWAKARSCVQFRPA